MTTKSAFPALGAPMPPAWVHGSSHAHRSPHGTPASLYADDRKPSKPAMKFAIARSPRQLAQKSRVKVKMVGAWLKSVVQGYLNYHAVPSNLKRLGMFRAEVCRAWMHAIRRRSQRSRMTWERFRRFIARYIPKVRTLHPYANQRLAS
jgi:hypothetical protein